MSEVSHDDQFVNLQAPEGTPFQEDTSNENLKQFCQIDYSIHEWRNMANKI